MASRGERTGARVEEAKAALRWWGHRSHLIKAGATEGGADQLADLIAQHELLDQHAEFDADQHAAAESAAEQVDTAESTAEAVAP